jgi:hypothetical protein
MVKKNGAKKDPKGPIGKFHCQDLFDLGQGYDKPTGFSCAEIICTKALSDDEFKVKYAGCYLCCLAIVEQLFSISSEFALAGEVAGKPTWAGDAAAYNDFIAFYTSKDKCPALPEDQKTTEEPLPTGFVEIKTQGATIYFDTQAQKLSTIRPEQQLQPVKPPQTECNPDDYKGCQFFQAKSEIKGDQVDGNERNKQPPPAPKATLAPLDAPLDTLDGGKKAPPKAPNAKRPKDDENTDPNIVNIVMPNNDPKKPNKITMDGTPLKGTSKQIQFLFRTRDEADMEHPHKRHGSLIL